MSAVDVGGHTTPDSASDPVPALSVAEIEALCRQRMPEDEFHALFGSVGHTEWSTYTNNVNALRKMVLRPRVLVDVRDRSLSTTVLGQEISLPVLVAPVGGLGDFARRGDIAAANAAHAAGTILVLSGVASLAITEVAPATPARIWQQIFLLKDRAATERQVAEATAAGCHAVVLTVSNTGAPLSPLKVPPRMRGLGATAGPPWDDGATWDDVSWLVSLTDRPVVVKGVQTGADAFRAIEHGARGIVVSNHGGRMLPDARPTVIALEEVVDAAGDKVEVYVDGGFTQGHDVLKALALGARAVLIGRATCWGLRVDGERGVARVLEILREELSNAMGWCGVRDVAHVGRDLVA